MLQEEPCPACSKTFCRHHATPTDHGCPAVEINITVPPDRDGTVNEQAIEMAERLGRFFGPTLTRTALERASNRSATGGASGDPRCALERAGGCQGSIS